MRTEVHGPIVPGSLVVLYTKNLSREALECMRRDMRHHVTKHVGHDKYAIILCEGDQTVGVETDTLAAAALAWYAAHKAVEQELTRALDAECRSHDDLLARFPWSSANAGDRETGGIFKTEAHYTLSAKRDASSAALDALLAACKAATTVGCPVVTCDDMPPDVVAIATGAPDDVTLRGWHLQ